MAVPAPHQASCVHEPIAAQRVTCGLCGDAQAIVVGADDAAKLLVFCAACGQYSAMLLSEADGPRAPR